MRLTLEQFNALSPYEKHFESMVKHKWARHPGTAALDLIYDIYCKVSGSNIKLNKGCSRCIGNLLEDMGRIYFADKEEMQKLIEDTIREQTGLDVHVVRDVAVKESLTTEPVKMEVKVKRGRKKKTE